MQVQHIQTALCTKPQEVQAKERNNQHNNTNISDFEYYKQQSAS